MLRSMSLSPAKSSFRTAYSSVNFKDALAATGAGGKIIRKYPLIGGIDAAGVVVSSSDARFKPGDEVICTSYDFGVAHDGGYAEHCRVPADWVVPLTGGPHAVRGDGARHGRLHGRTGDGVARVERHGAGQRARCS